MWAPGGRRLQEGASCATANSPRAAARCLADAFVTMFGALYCDVHGHYYIEIARELTAALALSSQRRHRALFSRCHVPRAACCCRFPLTLPLPRRILVGALMCGAVARVKWDDFTKPLPPLYSLPSFPPADVQYRYRLSLGLLSFTFVKLGTCPSHRENPPSSGSSVFSFLLRYAFRVPINVRSTQSVMVRIFHLGQSSLRRCPPHNIILQPEPFKYPSSRGTFAGARFSSNSAKAGGIVSCSGAPSAVSSACAAARQLANSTICSQSAEA